MTELYTPEWQAARASKYDPWSRRALLALFALEGIPRSMLDVGCGSGHLVWLAESIGVDAWGVDFTAVGDIGPIVHRDLTQPLDLGRPNLSTFELVISWEVAEHLPESAADTIVESVARHVGKLLVWTAAQPGQGGDGHLNEQPLAYWRQKLGARGLAYSEEATARLRATWLHCVGPAIWYARNAMLFRRP